MDSESGSSPKGRVTEMKSSENDMGAKLGSSSRLAELEGTCHTCMYMYTHRLIG